MRFLIWLSAKTLGVDSARALAPIIGKSPGQLSNWVQEKPRPSWENIKLMADTVGVSPSWLDDPNAKDAVVPDDWPAWWAPRAAKREAPAPSQRRRA